ncbi:mobilization protein [Methylobacterium sp. NEAU 140]|uniref:mobilization protein n=1 Tax=Methylobacterium sp. NEAU 140 TaxID=3064945 RepID=UPI0027362E1F|nr:mobilization protein [Methylobacterium sp. NEAU 140]MDP4026134.1 mobilization protein [Methylobacterium sp. NEAU 140]MDP4026708.1 mobilization protein [Methylobacterium sp. NEAU 140]
MARRTIAERIAQLDVRKKTLLARLDKQDRARDTRRKVLLGALVLQRLEAGHDPAFTQRLADWLRRELPGFLTRDADKALFADLIGPPAGTARTEAPVRGTGAVEAERAGDAAA